MQNLRGRAAFIFDEADFDVDQIVGVSNIRLQDADALAAVAMASFDPAFATTVRRGDVLIGGVNFGYGHPHYPPMMAMRKLGISCVIAESFSPGYWWGEIAGGFPQIPCPGILDLASRWDEIEVDWQAGVVTNHSSGKALAFQPLSRSEMCMLEAGGLVPYLQEMDTARAPQIGATLQHVPRRTSLMSSIHPSAALRSAVAGARSLVLPGAYDALSAKLVEEAGFEAIYVGSYATAAAGYGMPDVGALTLDQLVRHARTVVEAVSLPVIADAEGGFFEPANIGRTVHEFEKAGVAAIHIEDHAGGKHTDLPQRLVPLEDMLRRLRAAMDARQSPEFIVIARTDAIWATQDLDEALRRIEAFTKIGIEYIFANGASPAVLRQIRQRIDAKYVVINLPEVRDRDEWAGAADLVLDYGFCLQAVTQALKSALAQYRSSSLADASDRYLEDASIFEKRLGYRQFTERALKYATR